MSVFVVLCADDSGPVPVHDMTSLLQWLVMADLGHSCCAFPSIACVCVLLAFFLVFFFPCDEAPPPTPDVCFMTRWTRYFAFFFFFSFLLFCPWNALVSVAGLYVGPGPSCQI